VKRPRKLLDSANRYLLLGRKSVVGEWLKPGWFLPIQRVSGDAIRSKEEAFFSILGTAAKLEEMGFEMFVGRVI